MMSCYKYFFVFLFSLISFNSILAENNSNDIPILENTFYLPLNVKNTEDGVVHPYKLPKVSESHFNSYFYNYDGSVKETNEPIKKESESIGIEKIKEKEDLVDEFKKAVANTDLKRIKELFNKGLNKKYIDEYWKVGLISFACWDNNLKVIKYLVKSGVPLCPKGAENPIFSALTRAHVKSGVLQYLIDAGCDVNSKKKGVVYDSDDDNTPILAAAYDDDICTTINGVHQYCNHDGLFDVYDVLLKNGADIYHVNSLGQSVLDMVVISGANTAKLEYFIRNGINIDSNQEEKLNRALITSACCIQPECFKILLEYGADPFYKQDGENAIFISIHNDSENEEIMQMMFNAGVDVNERNKDGKTALYYTMPDRINSSYRLIKNGANVDIVLQSGSSPLIESCKRNGYYKCEDLWLLCRNEFNGIIKNVKNVDFKDKEGRTALMWVMISENKEKWFCNHIMMVKALVKAGADPNIKDNYGKSAIDYAKMLDKVSAEIYIKAMLQN